MGYKELKKRDKEWKSRRRRKRGDFRKGNMEEDVNGIEEKKKLTMWRREKREEKGGKKQQHAGRGKGK